MAHLPAEAQNWLARSLTMWIGGEQREAENGRSMPTYNPSTGEILGHVPDATEGDVDLAVRAAAAAQPAWQALGVRGRRQAFLRLADLVRQHRHELAMLEAVNSGNPYSAMLGDLDKSIQSLEDWPALALNLQGATYPSNSGDLHYTAHQPYGVVARIVAFNHPVMFAITRLCPALITGNTVVLKPADQTPLSVTALGHLISEAFPPGVFNIVTGGAAAGASLVRHPLVRRIAFTGSTAVGRRIQQTAAETSVKHVSLELGGKNPMIVFPDVDLDRAVAGAVNGMQFHICQGQSCGSNSRVFVHDDIYDRFAEAVAETVRKVRVGTAYRPETQMGPVVSEAHHNRVMSYIQSGKSEGARLLAGGDRPAGEECARGYFVSPTVFGDTNISMRIAREEIFGPVLSLFRWSDYETVIDQANNIEYGLTASVWTQDIDVALRTAERLQAGYVWVNDSSRHYWGTPFGGFKDSGLGKEECFEELYSYMETKAVHVRLHK